MIFIICLVVSIISIILTKLFVNNDHEWASFLSGLVALSTCAATIIMIIALAITYIGCPATEAKWQEQYKSLNTRIENHMYYPWSKDKLITEVQEWNIGLAAQQRTHGDFWVGIFNPESIDGLDYIDLNSIE